MIHAIYDGICKNKSTKKLPSGNQTWHWKIPYRCRFFHRTISYKWRFPWENTIKQPYTWSFFNGSQLVQAELRGWTTEQAIAKMNRSTFLMRPWKKKHIYIYHRVGEYYGVFGSHYINDSAKLSIVVN